MKQLFIFLLCMLGIVCHLRASSSLRRVENLNRGWRFALDDYEQASKPTFDDKDWETVGLPHSFSIPYFMSKDFYVGYGWYRKCLNFDKEEVGKAVFLEFDGIFQEAEVFVNGKLVGIHVGGYTGFSVDISNTVKAGQNLIAVRVNNLWKPDVAPRAGEHVFSGGIYRNVRLVVKSPVHIDWYGTFVTTPDLEKNLGVSSSVKVETDICNHSGKNGVYRLLTQVIAPDGKIVTSVEAKETVKAGSSKKFSQRTKALVNPLLWSPATPVLYKVASKLYQGKQLIDEYETTFGFRWFEWTVNRGFFLNGTHCYFRGVNVHQDQAGWGDAVTEAAMQRDVAMMKEAGFDLIRGSHYPHAPAFSQACDEQGMLFWSEAPFWGIGGFKSDGYWNSSAYPVNPADEVSFEESVLQQLTEMIRIHRNHPSIVAWSMCNEAFFSAPEAMPGVRRLLQRMVELTHQLDPTRSAAIGGAQRPLGEERIDRIGDLAGYNGDGATQPDFQAPGIPSVVSEYGSTTAERPGEYIPGWGDLTKGNGWQGRTWRSGQAIWCGFDHGSIAGSTLGKMGIVDYFRLPKRSWYWYRNEYGQTPPPEWAVEGVPTSLKLEATRTEGILTDGTDDVQLVVSILDVSGKRISNSPSVCLRVVSGPGEFPTGRSIRFEADSDIRIQDGLAAIVFRSYYAGTTVIEATSPGLKPIRLSLSFIGEENYRKGVTPETRERPYKRYIRQTSGEELLTFGPNNPTFASTQAEGQGAGMAADSNPQTYWQAADGDNAPWWMLDTEKKLILHSLDICFPKEGIHHYMIEVSENNKTWETILDNSHASVKEQKMTKVFAAQEKVVGRFIRIRFTQGMPAAISEVKACGIVCE